MSFSCPVPLNALSVSPDRSLAAIGGRDGSNTYTRTHAHTDTHTDTHTQTDTHTHTHTHRNTDTDTDTHIHTHVSCGVLVAALTDCGFGYVLPPACRVTFQC